MVVGDFEKFYKLIKDEKIWDFYELKACLLKYDGGWHVAFIRIQLLDEKIEKPNNLPVFEEVKFVYEIHKITEIHEILESLRDRKTIKIGRVNASLDLITSDFNLNELSRSISRDYLIDYFSYLLLTVGPHTSKVSQLERSVDNVLPHSSNPFENLRQACKKLLDIDFGTGAYAPFIIILAPIYSRISDYTFDNDKLTVNLECSQKINIKSLKLNYYCYDEIGIDVNLTGRAEISVRVGDDIRYYSSIALDKKITFVKLVVYYKQEIIDEQFAKRPTEIIDVKNVDALKNRKKDLLEKFHRAKTVTDKQSKGMLFEQVVEGILLMVENISVFDRDMDNGEQEIDLMVRNHSNVKVWKDFESVIFVECKNWTKKVPSKEIRNFHGKLVTRNMTSGILVAMNGISGKGGAAKAAVKSFFQKGIKIVVLQGGDIEDILNCRDVTDKVEEKYLELYKI